ncbi:MAG: hypothetical protein QOH13_762 [Thermoleophilaceae bacterium]|jgi:cytidine deaminase|nr:hypothetical protein [Thermoleophilaceae bacterium]
MTAAASYRPLSRLELVFGLVYGAGVEIGRVEELLDGYLDDFGYRLESIRLSDAFPAMLGESATYFPDATRRRQDQGDRLREHAGRNAAGRLAVFLMAGRRRRLDAGHPRPAWLVRSLRRPEEVQFLRQVYGPRFVLLEIHAPEALRLHNLTNRRREKSPSTSGPFEVGAIEDIKRDEQDVTVPHGQSMRTTFAEADFVVDSRSDEALRATLGRTIDILFGDPFATPSVERASDGPRLRFRRAQRRDGPAGRRCAHRRAREHRCYRHQRSPSWRRWPLLVRSSARPP